MQCLYTLGFETFCEAMEWVEIIEPRTKEHMYANLTTGECVWDPPPGVPVKKTDNNQWWELFDQSTSRFYYYNATSQKTVWHRPTDCDIIPLAKLQSMGACKPHSPLAEAQTSPPSPSPSARRYHHHHHHHHQNNNRHHHTGSSSRHVEQQTSQQPPPHLQQPQIPPQPPPPARRHHNHSQDSGRSSDSSVSHSRTSLESGSYRHGSAGAGGNVDSPAHRHHRSPNQAPPPPAPRQPKGGTLESAKSPKFLPAPPQPLARSYSFVQQQKSHQLQQQPHQQKQAKSPQQQLLQQQLQQKLQQKQPSSRRQDRDDDGMHERFLLPDQGRQRFSSVSSSASSNATDSSGSNSADAGDENDDPPPPIEEPSKKKRNGAHPSPPPSPFYGNLMVDADHLLPLQHYILQQAKLSGCYKFGDPLLAEEGDDSLDEEGGRDDDPHGRVDEDSDDQFADDEAASNQGDSSSQEYLDDHYADLANYDTTGIATYYNTADTLTRPHATPPPPPNIVSQAEARESVLSAAMRPHSLPAAPSARAAGGFSLSGIGSSCIDAGGDYDEGRRDDTAGGDIEKYAQDNLNLNCGRPKGLRLLFRKKCSVRDILSWSKDPIPQPMLAIVEGEKLLKREACNLFRLVQVYMGDRKANVGMTLDGVAMEIVNMVFSKAPLRDELYVQICRQTTENPRKESLRRGWELMAICLAFVSPSATFEPYLEGYMNRHRDPNFQFPEVAKWPIHVQVSHYATVACKRLQRIGAHGKRQPRKATVEDIDQARLQIFRASMFGATLSEVMALQRDRFPQRELPWIQTTLTRQVLIRGGTMTEGIFRVSADADEVNVLKSRLDKFEDGAILAASQDAHAPASLLKLWVRELYEPLIPDSFYAECVAMKHDDPEASAKNVAALVERLPELNRKVLCHLIHFLQVRIFYFEFIFFIHSGQSLYKLNFLQIFARPDVVSRTKMDASNLAMVMAPNILRCTSHDPRVILENARREMAFVRTMIETLETAWVEDLH
ncbi:unnamed protein product [Trichogramma brassicae]|uniref:Rho GTPase-activating protein 39 n=1 Tax=Trichogramma brassicae TaxID=86971 RepID=A0A6H5IIZ0_9HYME|nr:unnamed protein product [Trichogramma brassicae]